MVLFSRLMIVRRQTQLRWCVWVGGCDRLSTQHTPGGNQAGAGGWAAGSEWKQSVPSGFMQVCLVAVGSLSLSVYTFRLKLYVLWISASEAWCSFLCNPGLNKTKVSFDKGKGFSPVPHKSFFSVNHCHSAAWEQERSCRVWEDAMLGFESNFSLFSETVNGKNTLTN